jgi:CheY-like chemotaxis protein
MGHELRTPLNGIIGAANLLGKDLSPVDQKEYLGIVKYCSDHMLRLVNDILDFNKIEADQLDIHPVECNIKRLLHQSALPFYNRFEEKKLELKVTVDESIDEVVMVDDVRLVQVLNNLISNAWKFTETGSVNVVAKLQKREDNIATISFSVIDTGIGITKENQQKIFESFWQVFDQATRKYGGTGLGLTISKRLLILMNSHLEVESEGGKGSKFSFTLSLPVVSGKKQTTLNTELVSSDLNGMRILVVEDNIINMIIAKKILEDANALISKAENGQEALDVLQDDSSYDIILLDLEMPVMDGYTAIKEMKKFYPHIPVIAFTAALIDNEMWDKLITLGFSDCLLKPFQPLDLFAKVKKHTRPAAQQV